MTVTVRGHVHDKAYMEMRFVIKYRRSVFSHLAAQPLCRDTVYIADRIKCTRTYTSPAALAFILVNYSLSCIIRNGI